MVFQTLRAGLRGLTAYRALLKLPVPAAAAALLDALTAGEAEAALEHWADLTAALWQEGHESLHDALLDALRYTETPYPLAVERGEVHPGLAAAARRDAETLSRLAALDFGQVARRLSARLPAEYMPVLESLPCPAGAEIHFDDLHGFYLEHGCGLFARHRAFLWDGGLVPIPDPDCNGSDEMLGYELQRGQVLENTRALLAGRRVNNVLLYGEPGTGKSATVKSLLAAPRCAALRMIEVTRGGLASLPDLLRRLAGRRHRFVLLIDDLTFTRGDAGYAALKSVLEGGLEGQPVNTAIYATSNRRHLTRQTFSDRGYDEVDLRESVSESTSLADRFGLRIPYLPLSRPEFLELVERMADLQGLEIPADLLRAEAVKWEAANPGRTPRTAKQLLTALSAGR